MQWFQAAYYTCNWKSQRKKEREDRKNFKETVGEIFKFNENGKPTNPRKLSKPQAQENYTKAHQNQIP